MSDPCAYCDFIGPFVRDEWAVRELHRIGHEITRTWNRAFGPLIEAFGEISHAAKNAQQANYALTSAPAPEWPFAPGDVMHDSGPDGDDAAWLEAAPEGTLVNDGDGWDFVRDSGAWWHTGSWRMTSERIAERGPLTVVSVEAAR